MVLKIWTLVIWVLTPTQKTATHSDTYTQESDFSVVCFDQM